MNIQVDAGEAWRRVRSWVSRRPWSALVGLATTSLVGLGISGLEIQQSRAEHHRLQVKLAELQATLIAPESTASEPASFHADFTTKLPIYPDVRAIVAEIQRASSMAGVLIGEVQSQERPATAELLGHAELNVQLRGTYPNLKQVLREVQARYSHVTVRRLALRRASGPQDIEANVSLTLWSRPVQHREVQTPSGS